MGPPTRFPPPPSSTVPIPSFVTTRCRPAGSQIPWPRFPTLGPAAAQVPPTRLRAEGLQSFQLDPSVPWPSTVALLAPEGTVSLYPATGLSPLFDDPEMAHMQEPLRDVSLQYQTFLTKAEQYYCDAFRIPHAQRARYTGRGRPMQTRVLPLGTPTPKEKLYANPLANFFDSLSHRLKELALTLRPRRLGRITPAETRRQLV